VTLEQLLEKLAPDVARAFVAAIQEITDDALLQQVMEAVERNDVEAAFRALGFFPASFNGFAASLRAAFEAGANFMLMSFPKYVSGADGIKTRVRFNMRDPRAEQWLLDEAGTLITAIEQDTRNAVRNVMGDGMREGRNPRKVALDIVGRYNRDTGHREGGVVGLGQREETWSRNARTRLLTLDEGYFELSLRDKRFDGTVRAAIDAGKPLPADVVDKLVDRYRANALRHRGETIGRTEALHALNRSEWLATKQAVEQGNLRADAVTRVWDSAGDSRVRPAHRELDGQTVGIDEPFVSPVTGARMMHPGDTSLGAPGREVIGCRCRVRTVVDWFAGVT
jgi:hypothetical protein